LIRLIPSVSGSYQLDVLIGYPEYLKIERATDPWLPMVQVQRMTLIRSCRREVAFSI
jgi:hypothetical protein